MIEIHLVGFMPVIRGVTEQVLVNAPCKVVAYPSLESPQAFQPAVLPDILIADISPIWEGSLQFIAHLKMQFPPAVLIVTGDFDDAEIINQILNAGADTYLPTHEIPISLMDKVHQHVRRIKARRGEISYGK